MLIGLKHIKHLFNGEENIIKERSSCPNLTGFVLLKNAPVPYNDYTLYICDAVNELKYLNPVSNMHILFLAQEDDDIEEILGFASTAINILIVKIQNTNDAILKLQEFFHKKNICGLFSDGLMDILYHENGIQSIVDYAYQIFQNSVTVFDADFRLIALSNKSGMEKKSGKTVIETGGFSMDEFEILNKSHIHEKVKSSETPIHLPSDTFGFEQLVCAIDTKKNIGQIVLSETERPFRQSDYHLLISLKKAINQQLRKDEFVRNNKGFPYEYFLRDLLDGKIATGKQFSDRLSYTNHAFSGNLYCMVIETARSSQVLNNHHVRILLEGILPNTTTLMYHGEIIVIFDLMDNKKLGSENYEKINQICKDYGLFAGISNCFKNVVNISEYYKQALRAIELGICSQTEPSLFIYSNYYLEHITNIFAQKESLDTFSHPDLKILIDYDKENNSDLAYILFMYLINERNIVATAAALNLHRNSLQYRMKKINSLISMNYDDYQERQYYILSYNFYQGHRDE